MAWPREVFQFLNRKRPFCCGRIFLYLALSMALGGLASARYHFFWQNYSPFLTQQVLPAMGKTQWVDKALHGAVPPSKIRTTRLDTWPWASPMFRNQHHQYGESLIPVASDYLGVWHYTKMLLDGQNPYMIDFFFTYNFQAYNWPVLPDSRVPAQIVGPLSYPPFAALVLVPFFSASYFISLFKYYLVFGLFLLGGGIWIIRKAPQARVPLGLLCGTVLLTSYPIALLLDRGNIEGILFIFVALGIFSYHRKHYYLSALLIAMATCCKFYPAIFLGLFIMDRRWKPMLVSIIAIPLLTLVSLLVINAPLGQTISLFRHHLGGVNEFVLSDGRSVQFSHTLCTLVSGTLFAKFYDPRVGEMLRIFLRIYPYLVGSLTLGVFWRMRRQDLRTRVCVLTVMMIFFPFFSNDYTLIHLYIPLAWLLLDATRRLEWSLMDLLPIVLIGFISLPKHYLVGLFAMGPGVSFLMNGVALGGLLGLLLMKREDMTSGVSSLTAEG